jgi:hypothetical protein
MKQEEFKKGPVGVYEDGEMESGSRKRFSSRDSVGARVGE